jgi:hypothetical protein
MGFLRPKMPPPPPPPPPMPMLPPASPKEFTSQQVKQVKKAMIDTKKGHTETILTSTQGDESEADTYQKKLLGA